MLIFLKPSTVFGELRYGINCPEMKLTEIFLMLCNLYQNIKSCITLNGTGPRSAVGNGSGYRCVSDCRSRGREFDPGPVPYFRGD